MPEMSEPKFVPKTVYVTYIASTPEKVWAALTRRNSPGNFSSAAASRSSRGSAAALPCGCRTAASTSRDAWSNGIRRAGWRCTWGVDFGEFRELPESLVTYDIEPIGESVKLTMTEAHQWDVPDAILAGGRQGWPLILSSLKSVLETGKPIESAVKMGPPKEMLEAVKEACATKPWRDAAGR